MTGVSGVVGNIPNPAAALKIGDLIEFSGTGEIIDVPKGSALVRARIDGYELPGVFIPRSSVRVVVPPLKVDDVIDEEHREKLRRLPEGSALLYVGSGMLRPGLFQALGCAHFAIAGSEDKIVADDIPLPVRIVALGGTS